MKTIDKIIMTGIISVLMAGTISCQDAQKDSTVPAKGQPVKYQIKGTDNYRCFVKNWDDKKNPVLFALIRSPERWKTVFGSAPVMGGKKLPFGPDKKLYDQNQFIVVSKVTKPSATLNVAEVKSDQNNLILRYKFSDGKTKASYTVKKYFAIQIPKHDYQKIMFIENGKSVGSLDVAEGQWSVPEISKNSGRKKKKPAKRKSNSQ